MEQLGSHWTDFHKIIHLIFFENIWKKIQDLLEPYMKTNIHIGSYLNQFFVECEMLQLKVVEKIKTHILCAIIFFFENSVVYEIMWKNTVQLDRPQMAVWRMRIAC